MLGKRYNDKIFYFCLILLTMTFSIFYGKYAYYGDTAAHSLVSKMLLFQDVELDWSNVRFPIHVLAYPVYHFFQKMVHCILGIDYETAAAIVLTGSIVASVLLYRKLSLMLMENTVRNRYFADFFSLGAVLFGVARCGLNNWRYYSIQCSPNPFHNPTILFVRPFAIASFIFFIQLAKTYKSKSSYKYAFLFSLVSLVGVGAKPSYAIVLLPAMGIYTLYHMIQNKKLGFGIVAFIAVLPSLVLLIIQQIWVTSHSEALNAYIKFGFFHGFEELTTLGAITREVFLASLVTFPVVIFLFRIKWMKNDIAYFIAIFTLAFGWAEMYFLKAGVQGDFSWGYDLAVQFATLVSLVETRKEGESGNARKVFNIAMYLIFAYQVFTGMKYLLLVYNGIEYWI